MNRIELIKQLELVKPALSDTDLVDVFTHFMFTNGEISASNDALTIRAKSKPMKGKPFALKGSTLLGLLKASGGADVSFKLGEENDCVVSTGASEFKLPYLTQDSFLFEEPAKEPWTVSVALDEDTLNGIEICLTTSSRDLAAPAIMGVCFNLIEGSLTLYSCDGDAITRYKTIAKCEQNEEPISLTVPLSFCEALVKICRESNTATGSISISTQWVRAYLPNKYEIFGRLLENKAPLNHAELISETLTGKNVFVPLPEGFNEALSRARVVADPESKQTQIVVKGDKLTLLTETQTLGSVRDELSIKGMPAVKTQVYASLVQRSISLCDQIAIKENCTAFKKGEEVLQLISNVG